MIDDAGQLAIDFLIGFTIFMISLIVVLTFISGTFVGLQSRTIDYDAVAYRTGVILAEDPGEPNEHVGVTKLEVNNSWEFIKWNQKNPNSTTGEGGVKTFWTTPHKNIPPTLGLKKIKELRVKFN